jgi:hypothetical protein
MAMLSSTRPVSGRYAIHVNPLNDSGGRGVLDVGLRPLACWDCGFESRRVHGGKGLCVGPITRPEESYRVDMCQ